MAVPSSDATSKDLYTGATGENNLGWLVPGEGGTSPSSSAPTKPLVVSTTYGTTGHSNTERQVRTIEPVVKNPVSKEPEAQGSPVLSSSSSGSSSSSPIRRGRGSASSPNSAAMELQTEKTDREGDGKEKKVLTCTSKVSLFCSRWLCSSSPKGNLESPEEPSEHAFCSGLKRWICFSGLTLILTVIVAHQLP